MPEEIPALSDPDASFVGLWGRLPEGMEKTHLLSLSDSSAQGKQMEWPVEAQAVLPEDKPCSYRGGALEVGPAPTHASHPVPTGLSPRGEALGLFAGALSWPLRIQAPPDISEIKGGLLKRYLQFLEAPSVGQAWSPAVPSTLAAISRHGPSLP